GQDMTTLINGLQNIDQKLNEVLENQNFQTLAGSVNTVQDTVQSRLTTLVGLKSNSPTGAGTPAADLVSGLVSDGLTPRTTIHNAMVTGALISSPGQYGLLRMYADKCVQACLGDASFSRGAFQVGGPLDTNYQDLQNYFESLISLQVQAMTLLFNAVNA